MQEKKQALIDLTSLFCEQYLDAEYAELAQKLIKKMSRKRQAPFFYGRLEIWSGGIIHALGSINFLFDKQTQPYIESPLIAEHFGCAASTIAQKSRNIREMFKMRYWDPEFSTQLVKKKNPFANYVFNNGFIVKIN